VIVLEVEVSGQNTMFCGILTGDVLSPPCLRAGSLLAVFTVGYDGLLGYRFPDLHVPSIELRINELLGSLVHGLYRLASKMEESNL
jgi:hypothetical protein